MKFFTKEVKIALVAILGIVVLYYGLTFLKGLTVFANDDSYYVTFTDVSGVSASQNRTPTTCSSQTPADCHNHHQSMLMGSK